MDILSALNVLRTATDDALKCHTAETILTLKKVGERLKASLLPSSPCRNASEVSAPPLSDSIASTPSPPNGCTAEASSSPGHFTANDSSSHDSSSGTSSAITRCSVCNAIAIPVDAPRNDKALRDESRRKASDVVSKLDRAIKRTTPWIWDTSNGDLGSIISRKRKSGEDLRLDDIRRVEGDPESSDNNKLLRLLAIRSFATEFTTEQSHDKSQTRVDELVAYVQSVKAGNNEDQPDSRSKGRRSDVSNFVGHHPKLSSTAPALANRAINNGIKHLVFEIVLKHRLQRLGLPDMCEAVSAILGLNIYNFRALPYKQMPALLDVLLSDGMCVSLQTEREPEKEDKRHILDIIRDVNSWFTKLQANYDGEHRTWYQIL